MALIFQIRASRNPMSIGMSFGQPGELHPAYKPTILLQSVSFRRNRQNRRLLQVLGLYIFCSYNYLRTKFHINHWTDFFLIWSHSSKYLNIKSTFIFISRTYIFGKICWTSEFLLFFCWSKTGKLTTYLWLVRIFYYQFNCLTTR